MITTTTTRSGRGTFIGDAPPYRPPVLRQRAHARPPRAGGVIARNAARSRAMKPTTPPFALTASEIEKTMTNAMIAQIGKSRASGRAVRHGSTKPRMRRVRPAPAVAPIQSPRKPRKTASSSAPMIAPIAPPRSMSSLTGAMPARCRARCRPGAGTGRSRRGARRPASRRSRAARRPAASVFHRLGRRGDLEGDDRTLGPVLVRQDDRHDIEAKGVAARRRLERHGDASPRAAPCRRSGSRARSGRRGSASRPGSGRSATSEARARTGVAGLVGDREHGRPGAIGPEQDRIRRRRDVEGGGHRQSLPPARKRA